MMVNFLYHPGEIERNHEAFARQGLIMVSPDVRDLLKGAPEPVAAQVRVSRRGSRLGRMIRRP
jgi:hypothetical protein